MKAIILTAGEGAHFHPLTVTRPKGMSIVAGKPILQHTVEALAQVGVTDIWFVVGYKPERLRTFFGNGNNFGIKAHYVEQPSPLGTGAAVRLAAEALDPQTDTLVLFGDNRYGADLIRTVLETPGDVVLGTTESDPRRNGLIIAKSGKLADYEFPSESQRGLVNSGVMKFRPRFFQFLLQLEAREAAQLPHVLAAYVKAGNEITVPTASHGWDEADTVWDLLRLNEHLLDAVQPSSHPAPEGVRVEGRVFIGAGTKIASGAQLIGPTYIGADCEIRENAIVGPYVSLRNNVHIGTNSEVRHSIVNNNVYVDSQTIVRFSVLDDGARIGPFSVLAEGAISGTEPGQLPSQHGVIVGPDVRLGARVIVKPGSILGESSNVGDGVVVATLAARAGQV